MGRVTLLLNTLLVVVNFVLIVGQSDLNDTTMRASARVFAIPVCLERGVTENAQALADASAPSTGPAGAGPASRLYNYLAHSRETETLSPEQWACIIDIARRCDLELRASLGADLARARSGTDVRQRIESAFDRARAMIQEELERSGVGDSRSRSHLASVILASSS